MSVVIMPWSPIKKLPSGVDTSTSGDSSVLDGLERFQILKDIAVKPSSPEIAAINAMW